MFRTLSRAHNLGGHDAPDGHSYFVLPTLSVLFTIRRAYSTHHAHTHTCTHTCTHTHAHVRARTYSSSILLLLSLLGPSTISCVEDPASQAFFREHVPDTERESSLEPQDETVLAELEAPNGAKILLVEVEGSVGVIEISEAESGYLNFIQDHDHTPLELFLSLAPPDIETPELLEYDHDARVDLLGRRETRVRALSIPEELQTAPSKSSTAALNCGKFESWCSDYLSTYTSRQEMCHSKSNTSIRPYIKIGNSPYKWYYDQKFGLWMYSQIAVCNSPDSDKKITVKIKRKSNIYGDPTSSSGGWALSLTTSLPPGSSTRLGFLSDARYTYYAAAVAGEGKWRAKLARSWNRCGPGPCI